MVILNINSRITYFQLLHYPNLWDNREFTILKRLFYQVRKYKKIGSREEKM